MSPAATGVAASAGRCGRVMTWAAELVGGSGVTACRLGRVFATSTMLGRRAASGDIIVFSIGVNGPLRVGGSDSPEATR